MIEKQIKNESSALFSTYGLITAERVLEKYKLKLPQDSLLKAIQNTQSFYSQLLQIPLKNILNGIIIQQIGDYQTYTQKLVMDYLLSGVVNEDSQTSGLEVRKDLEIERLKLITFNEAVQQLEGNHSRLIAETQRHHMELVDKWQKNLAETASMLRKRKEMKEFSQPLLIQALNILLVQQDFSKISNGEEVNWVQLETLLKHDLDKNRRLLFIESLTDIRDCMDEVQQSLTTYLPKILALNQQLCDYRDGFYNLILRFNELIRILPEYRDDLEQKKANQESLIFDRELGKNLT